MFLTVGMLVIHSTIEDGRFLDFKNKTSIFKAMTALYIFLYLIATVLIIIRVVAHKKICSVAFAVYFIGSIILIVINGALGVEISNW